MTLSEIKIKAKQCVNNPMIAMREGPQLVLNLLLVIEGLESRINKIEDKNNDTRGCE